MFENIKFDTNFKVTKNIRIENIVIFPNTDLKKIYEALTKKICGFKVVGVKHHKYQEIYFLEKDNQLIKIQIFYNKHYTPTFLKIVSSTNQKIAQDFISQFIKKHGDNKIVKAYVDGSFEPPGKIGAGIVILSNNHIEKYYKFITKYPEHRNVTGEIVAALLAFKYAKMEKIKQIEILYDYEGIKKWATGEWKTKTDITKKYKEMYNMYSKYIDIKFSKIKSHSGNKYNELADKLAKEAAKKMITKVKYDIEI
ncbi:MAG: ribonuclease H [Thermosipho sp. (in: Bacteria)]|nr:ribonuclease H [Thermosipho sp. (in: thermotogales)]